MFVLGGRVFQPAVSGQVKDVKTAPKIESVFVRFLCASSFRMICGARFLPHLVADSLYRFLYSMNWFNSATRLAARDKSPNDAICSVPPSVAGGILGRIWLLRGTPGTETGRYRTFCRVLPDASANATISRAVNLSESFVWWRGRISKGIRQSGAFQERVPKWKFGNEKNEKKFGNQKNPQFR